MENLRYSEWHFISPVEISREGVARIACPAENRAKYLCV